MAGKNRHHLLNRDLAFQQLRHGCDVTARNAARINRFEIAQIGGHVQSKPVHGDPFSDTDSDRCQFAFIGPDPGQALPSAGAQAKVADGSDEAFLQVSQVQMKVTSSPAQIQNRVTNQLTGTMISNVSSAGNVEGLDGSVRCGGCSATGPLTLSPDGEHVRVLEQKGPFRALAAAQGLEGPCLQVKGCLVVDEAQFLYLHSFILTPSVSRSTFHVPRSTMTTTER